MQEQVSTARIALKYGIITAVAVIVYSTLLTVTGLNQNQALSSLGFVILIAGIVWAMRDYREQNSGFMSFGQGLGIGSLMSAIVGLFGAMFTMFYMQFIDTTLIQQSLNKAREDLEKRGMDDTQIDQAMEISQKFMTPGVMFLVQVLTYLVVGFIISLILAAILRKEKPVFE
jgi:predicted membrane protein